MKLYDQTEISRIENVKQTNDKMEEYFNQQKVEWNDKINPLLESIKNRITIETQEKVLDNQSLALVYRQALNDQISFFLNKRSKEEVKYKRIKQDKFIFYSIGDGAALKTNASEKALLMDAHLAESDRAMQLIESHIEFLRSSIKNLEGLGFTYKQIIDLMNHLGR
jgi:hypothetical protein